MKFTKERLEQAIIELLEGEGYPHVDRDEVYKEILEQAKQNADKLIEKAKMEIAKERDDALHALRGEVADLTIAATRKIIGESLDEEKQKSIISDFIKKMPNSIQN